jgi:hypothetical protein
MERTVCTACRRRVEPVAPRTTWKVVTVLLWVATLIVGEFFGILLGLNIVLMPMWIGIALSVGVAARRASSWTCPECSEEITGYVPEREREPRRDLVPQPA